MKDEALGLRDLAKSMMSCAWAISIFGMRQMTSLLTAPGRAQATKLAQAVDKLTDATTATFDDSTQTIYRAGTSIQNAVIDVTLGGAMFDAPKPSERPTSSSEPVPAADVLVSHPSDGQRQKPVAGDETEEDWTLKVQ
jgi:hypothetical protein